MHVPFWFFGVISIIMGIFIYIHVPETEHKSLEDIMVDLRNNKRATGVHEAREKLYELKRIK